MKRTNVSLLIAGLLCWGSVQTGVAAEPGAITPDDLIKAAGEMTPEQAYEFQQKLDASTWKPVPEGFFSRMTYDLGVGIGKFDDVNLSGVTLSAGSLDLEEVSGGEMGIAWKFFDEFLRVGFDMASWYAEDSNFSAGTYSGAELQAGLGTITLAAQWIRAEHLLLWTELGVGGGSVELEILDTPGGSGSTLRKLDAVFGIVDVEAAVAWRFNPLLSLYLSGGYRFSGKEHFEEGGTEIDATIDPSGYQALLGLNVNF